MGAKKSEEHGAAWVVETAMGKMRIEVDAQERLVSMIWAQRDELPQTGKLPATIRMLVKQLNEYELGEREEIDVPLGEGVPRGTEFEKKVWKVTRTICRGATRTYGEIAREVGSPEASRAVGAAMGKNPLPFIVPCHRVVGSTGKLTGYAGGVEVKRRLLELESGGRWGKSAKDSR